jgi:hypothetical protein
LPILILTATLESDSVEVALFGRVAPDRCLHAASKPRLRYDENMDTPKYRLETIKEKIRNAPGNEAAQRVAQSEINVDCAIEIAEALIGLKVAMNSMANQVATVMINLTAAIDKATAQAVLSSEESTKVAIESTKLSGHLNRLTKWIIAAAVLSAIAAIVQAGAAVYIVVTK